MELVIKSVTWDMVKNELSMYQEYKDLSNFIRGGCVGSPENRNKSNNTGESATS